MMIKMANRPYVISGTANPQIGEIEAWAQSQGFDFLFGIDEAGRGPWAGPVVCACVVFPLFLEDKPNSLLAVNDSKQLKHQKRRKLLQPIRDYALAVGVAQVKAEEIDQINILQATFKGMGLAVIQAINRLKKQGIQPQKPLFLVDGNQIIPQLSQLTQGLLGIPIEQRAVIQGDGRSIHIAAASILAKEYRDRLLRYLDYLYPQYGFKAHKGYGTQQHQKALKQYGVSPVHRLSYAPIKALLDINSKQASVIDKTIEIEAAIESGIQFSLFSDEEDQ
jgi:ribonuclease HII